MENFSLVYSRTDLRSAQDDVTAAQSGGTLSVVAEFGRAPTLLAIGLAVLISGFANHTVGSEYQQFNRATRVPEADGRLQIAAPAESRSAQDGRTPSSEFNRMLDDYFVAGMFDSAKLRNAARAGEMQNLVQPKVGVAQPKAHYPLPSASAMSTGPWSLGVSGTAMFRDYDHATLAAYLPMKNLRALNKITGWVFESPVPGSIVANLQALSLLARGRINTEFTYSTHFNKYSRLDARAVYRLNAHTNTGNSDLVVGLYYSAAF